MRIRPTAISRVVNANNTPRYGNALTAAANDGTLQIIQALSENTGKKAEIDAESGWALQIAAYQGHLDVVKYLVEVGKADVNRIIQNVQPRSHVYTALHAACVAQHKDVVAYLLTKGANPNNGGGRFTCPIIAAARRGNQDILQLLTDPAIATCPEKIEVNVLGTAGRDWANRNGGDSNGRDPNSTEQNKGDGKRTDEDRSDGHRGQGHRGDRSEGGRNRGERNRGNRDGGDRNGRGRMGGGRNGGGRSQRTALMEAARCLPVESVKQLVKAGADVNLAAPDKNTALIVAAGLGKVDIVQYLIEEKANILHVGLNGTALKVANAEGHATCVKVLSDAMEPILSHLYEASEAGNTFSKNLISGVSNTEEVPTVDIERTNHQLEQDVQTLKKDLAEKTQEIERITQQLKNDSAERTRELERTSQQLKSLEEARKREIAASAAKEIDLMQAAGIWQIQNERLSTEFATVSAELERTRSIATQLEQAKSEIEALTKELNQYRWRQPMSPDLTPESLAQRNLSMDSLSSTLRTNGTGSNSDQAYASDVGSPEDVNQRSSFQGPFNGQTASDRPARKSIMSAALRQVSRDMTNEAARGVASLNLSMMKFGKGKGPATQDF